MIVNKRKIVFEDLETYEQRSKRYWDQRLDGRDTKRMNIDPLDANIEDELKELMRGEEQILDVLKDVDDSAVFQEIESSPKVANGTGQESLKVEETESDLQMPEESVNSVQE